MNRAELLELHASDAREDVHPHVALVGLDRGALQLIVELAEPDSLHVVRVRHLGWLDERPLLSGRDRLTQCALGFGLARESTLPAVLAVACGWIDDVLDVRPFFPRLRT